MVDSHCHLDFPDYQGDFSEVIKRAQTALEFVINVGTDIKASERVVDLGEEYPFMYSSVGIHPYEAATVTTVDLDRLATLASNDKVVAVGECGLDYSRLNNGDEDKKIQKKLFQEHIKIANSQQLPLIVHCRDAYEDLLDIFIKGSNEWRGVIHCYLGDVELANKFMDLGFYVSFTGIITFKNAAPALLEAVRQVPLDRMLIETDAPFLAPSPHRGKRNEPAYVVEVANKIAQIKNIDPEEVDQQTSKNARILFGIS